MRKLTGPRLILYVFDDEDIDLILSLSLSRSRSTSRLEIFLFSEQTPKLFILLCQRAETRAASKNEQGIST